MRERCTRCHERIRPHANYCGRCGSEVTHAPEPVVCEAPLAVVPPPMPVLPVTAMEPELLARMQLEAMTRLSPRMNRERAKAAVMRIAARGGNGSVGYWCDD